MEQATGRRSFDFSSWIAQFAREPSDSGIDLE
jgi:hypothetical protein